MRHDELEHLLRHLVRSRAGSNAAFDALLDDYTKFHAVLVVLGTLVTVGLLLLSLGAWTRFRRAPKRRFERTALRGLAIASASAALLTGVVVAANLSNVVDPRHGFSGAIPVLGSARPGTEQARVHHAALVWLRSGRADPPPLIRRKVDDRLSWQRPKAIVSSVLLLAFLALCARLWSRLLARSRTRPRGARWTLREAAHLAAAVGALAPTLLLLVMAVANTQASFAPLTLTLLYG